MKVHSHQRTALLAVTIIAAVGFTAMWVRLPSNMWVRLPSSMWVRPPSSKSTPVVPLSSLPPKPRALTSPSRLLPHKYWEHRALYPENYSQISCNNFPRYQDIHYAAASWQHIAVANGNVYVYGAYWDDRFDEPLVRVLVYCDVLPLPTLMCQLWYENENAPVTVPSTVTYGWRPAWGGPKDAVNEPYILACRARRHPPDKQRAPSAVSVVLDGQLCGTPTNVLNVQNAPVSDEPRFPPNSTSISVCLKWVQFQDDVSAELVEWIELIKAFGADKLFVFEVQSHPNARRVLDHYAATGFADVTQFAHMPQLRSNFSPPQENFHDYRRELLPLNDCLYRSMYKYQWMAPIDSDEIIVPRSLDTWQQIITEESEGVTGLDAMIFRNYYFLDGAQRNLAAPPYMKKLGHLWRGRQPNPPGYNVKAFHNTSSVVAMHNHYPMSCGVSGNCWSRDVNTTVARLQHYRARCGDDTNDCPALHDTLKDITITKWKYVTKEVDRVLIELGIKPKI